MTRYFFHVDNGEWAPDTDGTEFQTDKAARDAAVLASAEALRDKPYFWGESPIWRMYVTDETDRLILTLSFTAKEPSGPVFLRAEAGRPA
jgi:hypothetical protein